MALPIKGKIDVTKIVKEHLFKGKKGIYLDLVIWPNRDGAGQYGDTHYITQDLPKAIRDGGTKNPIIGNLSIPDGQGTRQTSPAEAPQADAQDDSGEVPF